MSDTPDTIDVETDELDGVEDFDAFWQSVDRKGTPVKVAGEIITLPPALPLQFELESRRLQRSKRDEDVHKLLSLLGFPEDAQTRWAEAGMDMEQFQVLLAWAPQRIAGKPVTLAEVRDDLAEHNAKQAARAEGKGRRKR